jgi:Tol biopolymer transport system component
MDWARDGSAIYYNLERPEGGHEIWMLPLTGANRSPRPFLRATQSRDWIAISPDSRWVLYRTGRRPESNVLLRPLRDESGESRTIGLGMSEAHWRSDSKQIYFISGDNMMAQDVDVNGSELHLGNAVTLFRAPQPNYFGRNAFVVTPDGERFLIRVGP